MVSNPAHLSPLKLKSYAIYSPTKIAEIAGAEPEDVLSAIAQLGGSIAPEIQIDGVGFFGQLDMEKIVAAIVVE